MPPGSGKDGHAIQGVADLDLRHLYRAMAWLGEVLPHDRQDGATPFAPRTNKDLIKLILNTTLAEVI